VSIKHLKALDMGLGSWIADCCIKQPFGTDSTLLFLFPFRFPQNPSFSSSFFVFLDPVFLNLEHMLAGHVLQLLIHIVLWFKFCDSHEESHSLSGVLGRILQPQLVPIMRACYLLLLTNMVTKVCAFRAPR